MLLMVLRPDGGNVSSYFSRLFLRPTEANVRFEAAADALEV